jgi:gamma-glutamyltranspeptidase/glutathione hydrolase
LISRRELFVLAGASALACRETRSVRPAGRGAVATSQRHATKVGIEILRAGGNAADAAIACAAALNVTEPTSTGIGGDAFALYFDAKTKQITALNGSGRAPMALAIANAKFEARHAHMVTVPGACAAWMDLLDRHGSMSRSDVLAPAIALATEGFAVGELTAQYWARGAEIVRAAPNFGELLIDGRAPRGGETFRNPGLAKTFEIVAKGGRDAFYDDVIAQAIVDTLSTVGGAMTVQDLAAHRSTWDTPISTTYRDRRVWECPPNGQGIAALLALNVLETFERVDMHLMIEALRLAFADTRWYVADPAKTKVPVDELLSKDYAKQRAKLVDPKRATADVTRGSPIGTSETVYFCVVDGAGNACSFINSNYMGFGTGIVPKGFGFTLQNRGFNFSSDPAHPNALAPGKRPYHTIIPAMLTHLDGSLDCPFGVMGGFMQPQGHVQIVNALVDDKLPAQAAIDRPRFCIEPVDGKGQIHLEEGAANAEDLRTRGHDVVANVGGLDRALFGRSQIIRSRATDVIDGGSDRRADGAYERA